MVQLLVPWQDDHFNQIQGDQQVGIIRNQRW